MKNTIYVSVIVVLSLGLASSLAGTFTRRMPSGKVFRYISEGRPRAWLKGMPSSGNLASLTQVMLMRRPSSSGTLLYCWAA